MTWTREIPTEPGRYWWRDMLLKNLPHADYGVMLVAWSAGYSFDHTPPHLVVRSLVGMGGHSGEKERDGGWYTNSGGDVVRWFEKHQTVQIWSEPIVSPDPNWPLRALHGKPEWVPPLPAPPTKCTCQGRKPHKRVATCKTPEDEEREAREQKIAEASEAGRNLFVCEECEELFDEDEVIIVRECPMSGCEDSRFNGTENGQSCPDCNRTFTRKVTETGCPDCIAECEPFEFPATDPVSQPVT